MQARSNEPQFVQLDRYGLVINTACYLVTVSNTTGTRSQASATEIPEWIFNSKHAIWLTEEEKPIADRARSGDEIKRKLRALLSLR